MSSVYLCEFLLRLAYIVTWRAKSVVSLAGQKVIWIFPLDAIEKLEQPFLENPKLRWYIYLAVVVEWLGT